MTRQEIAQLVELAFANFPHLQNHSSARVCQLWEAALSDMPFQVAKNALVKVLVSARYFPTVAEIREAAVSLTAPPVMTALEAWHMVMNAVRRYGYYREQEALASLPADVADMVRRFGWREICACEEPDVMRGQFRRAWDTHAEGRRQLAVLPAPLRALIEAQAAACALPGTESEPVRAIPAPSVVPDPGSDAGEPVADDVAIAHIGKIRRILDAVTDDNGEETKQAAAAALYELAALRKERAKIGRKEGEEGKTQFAHA